MCRSSLTTLIWSNKIEWHFLHCRWIVNEFFWWITMNVVRQSEHIMRVCNGLTCHPVNWMENTQSNVVDFGFSLFAEHTLIQLRKLFPYTRSNAALMSFKSTSHRVTINRINCWSFVPMPAILLCKRLAKNSALLVVHCKMAIRPSIISPLNSLRIACSNPWPVIRLYSSQICWAKFEIYSHSSLENSASIHALTKLICA